MEFRAGQLTQAEAARLNWLVRRVEALSRPRVTGGLQLKFGPDGQPVFAVSTSTHGVLIGELDEDLDFEAEATVSVWRWDGSAYVDSGDNVEAACFMLETGESIASGTKVMLAWEGRSGRWEVINERCP